MQLSNVIKSKYTLVGLENNNAVYRFNVRSNVYLPNDVTIDSHDNVVSYDPPYGYSAKAVSVAKKKPLMITVRSAAIILIGLTLVFGCMLTQHIMKIRELEEQIVIYEQKIAQAKIDIERLEKKVQEVRDPARIGYLAVKMGMRPADSVESVKVEALPTRY